VLKKIAEGIGKMKLKALITVGLCWWNIASASVPNPQPSPLPPKSLATESFSWNGVCSLDEAPTPVAAPSGTPSDPDRDGYIVKAWDQAHDVVGTLFIPLKAFNDSTCVKNTTVYQAAFKDIIPTDTIDDFQGWIEVAQRNTFGEQSASAWLLVGIPSTPVIIPSNPLPMKTIFMTPTSTPQATPTCGMAVGDTARDNLFPGRSNQHPCYYPSGGGTGIATITGGACSTGFVVSFGTCETNVDIQTSELTLVAKAVPLTTPAPTPSPTIDTTVTLAWNLSPDPTVVGYQLSWGTASQTYTQSQDAGDAAMIIISGLDYSTTYYFSVRAFNAAGLYSAYAPEISATTIADSLAAPTNLIVTGS